MLAVAIVAKLTFSGHSFFHNAPGSCTFVAHFGYQEQCVTLTMDLHKSPHFVIRLSGCLAVYSVGNLCFRAKSVTHNIDYTNFVVTYCSQMFSLAMTKCFNTNSFLIFQTIFSRLIYLELFKKCGSSL